MVGAPDDYMEYRKGMCFEFSEGENIACHGYVFQTLLICLGFFEENRGLGGD